MFYAFGPRFRMLDASFFAFRVLKRLVIANERAFGRHSKVVFFVGVAVARRCGSWRGLLLCGSEGHQCKRRNQVLKIGHRDCCVWLWYIYIIMIAL